MGEGLNKPIFAQRCLQTFFIFISRAQPSFSRALIARELADVFEKNEKKHKTASVYRLDLICLTCSNFLFISRSGITLQTTSD